MKKEASEDKDVNMSTTIKNLGGAKAIQRFLVSKGHNINIESIYKWKKNGIPYRYRDLINNLQNMELINNKNKNIEKDITQTEIISNSLKFKKPIKFIIVFIIILLLISFLYIKNDKKIELLNTKLLKLENNIIDIQENYLNRYQIEIGQMSNELKNQSSINKLNKENIQKIYDNYSNYDELISNNEDNLIVQNIDEIEKFTDTLKEKEAILYLFWLKDNIYNTPNLKKLTYFIEHMNKQTMPNDIKNSLSVLSELKNNQPKNIIQLITDINNILQDDRDSKNNIELNNDNKIFKKFKNLIKITKIDNKNNTFLMENTSKSLLNYEFDNAIYLISSANIKPSIKLNTWVSDVKKLSNINESLENILNWMIYRGK